MLEQLRDGLSTDGMTQVWKLRQHQCGVEFREFLNKMNAEEYVTACSLAGIIIGPIIAAFFLTVWEIAAEEFAATDKT